MGPVAAGTQEGEMEVTVGRRLVLSVPLVTATDVPAALGVPPAPAVVSGV